MYFGFGTRASADSVLYETVIGAEQVGLGNYSTILGSNSNKLVGLFGRVKTIPVEDNIQFIVRGHSTQTNNLTEWRNNSETVLSNITGTGGLHLGDSLDLSSGKNITLIAGNIITDTTTGTKIGTATSQKFAFFNSTPIIQPVNTIAIDTALTNLGLRASGGVALFDTDVKVGIVGKGLYVKEGSNATMGTGTLSSGTSTISTTKVTANSRIFITDTGGGIAANIGALYVSAVSAGTSFTVTSMNVIDSSNFNWFIIEPA